MSVKILTPDTWKLSNSRCLNFEKFSSFGFYWTIESLNCEEKNGSWNTTLVRVIPLDIQFSSTYLKAYKYYNLKLDKINEDETYLFYKLKIDYITLFPTVKNLIMRRKDFLLTKYFSNINENAFNSLKSAINCFEENIHKFIIRMPKTEILLTDEPVDSEELENPSPSYNVDDRPLTVEEPQDDGSVAYTYTLPQNSHTYIVSSRDISANTITFTYNYNTNETSVSSYWSSSV